MLAALCGGWLGCFKCEGVAPDPKLHADGLYLAASSAFMEGKYEEAEAKFKEAQGLNPADPRLPAALGELYWAQGKLHEAKASFEAAIKVDATRSTTFSRLGNVQLRLGDTAAAEASLRRALTLRPEDFNALDDLARIAVKKGDTDGGVALWVQSAQLAPSGTKASFIMDAARVLVREQRDAEALRLLEGARARGEASPELLAELGTRLMDAKRFDEALAVWRELLALKPKQVSTWQVVGELELKKGNVAEAEEALRKSVALKPTATAHAALARLCQREGKHACANDELKAALDKVTGEDPVEVLAAAEALSVVGRPSDALKLLEILLATPQLKDEPSLMLKAAALAKAAGDKAGIKKWCAQARAVDAGMRCP